MKKPVTFYVGSGVYYAVCLILVIVFAGPFFWMLSNALKPPNEIFVNPPILISENFTIENFIEVFRQSPFALYMLNSFFVAITVTVISLILHAMAGYALARLEFPGKNIMFFIILSTLMVPFYTIIIPLALMMRELDWTNTYWALIIPAIPHAFGIFWLRQFFMGMPSELEDAARIDGSSRFGVFFHIALPLAKPVLAALSVFFFLANWDAFLWPLVVANRPEMRMVQVGIQSFTGEHGNAWQLIMAASVISILPTLALFFGLQRYIVESVKMTGLKG